MITEITPEQWQRLQEECEKYLQLGLQTGPADRPRAERILLCGLHELSTERYRRLFMWSLLSEETKKEARQLAFRRYLHESMSIMENLNPGSAAYYDCVPGIYNAQTAEEFRAEIDALRKKYTP